MKKNNLHMVDIPMSKLIIVIVLFLGIIFIGTKTSISSTEFMVDTSQETLFDGWDGNGNSDIGAITQTYKTAIKIKEKPTNPITKLEVYTQWGYSLGPINNLKCGVQNSGVNGFPSGTFLSFWMCPSQGRGSCVGWTNIYLNQFQPVIVDTEPWWIVCESDTELGYAAIRGWTVSSPTSLVTVYDERGSGTASMPPNFDKAYYTYDEGIRWQPVYGAANILYKVWTSPIVVPTIVETNLSEPIIELNNNIENKTITVYEPEKGDVVPENLNNEPYELTIEPENRNILQRLMDWIKEKLGLNT